MSLSQAETTITPVSAQSIAQAAALLRSGKLVAMPTETVYGLAADAANGNAVASIFDAKGRPSFNPLIVHVATVEDAARYGEFCETARALAQAFWPGPLTLVVAAQADSPISPLTVAGLDTIALRVPEHEAARALISEAGLPLAAPSANRSGHVSPTTAEAVAQDLGARVSLILDGGPCKVGLESTVVGVFEGGVHLLRPGGITRAMLEEVCGPLHADQGNPERPRSPGQLLKHYAPRAPVRLNTDHAQPGEGLLAFGPYPAESGDTVLNLSPSGDLKEAAANLFSYLRRLDAETVTGIAVMPIPAEGLGEAINDRLARAAAASKEG